MFQPIPTLPDLTPAVDAIKARAWYPFASIVLTFLIAAWKRVQPQVWDRIPDRYQWLVSALVAAAVAFVDAAAHSLGVEAALALAFYSLFAVAASAIGLHHAQKGMRS